MREVSPENLERIGVHVELIYLYLENSQGTTFSGTTHVTKRYRNYIIGTLIIKSVSALTQWTVGVQNVNVEFYSFHQSKISINRAGGATCWTLAPEVPSAPIKSQLSHAHPALGVMQLPSFNLTTGVRATHDRYRNYTAPPLRYLNFTGKLVLQLRYWLLFAFRAKSSRIFLFLKKLQLGTLPTP